VFRAKGVGRGIERDVEVELPHVSTSLHVEMGVRSSWRAVPVSQDGGRKAASARLKRMRRKSYSDHYEWECKA
jgi:hypothetical protein